MSSLSGNRQFRGLDKLFGVQGAERHTVRVRISLQAYRECRIIDRASGTRSALQSLRSVVNKANRAEKMKAKNAMLIAPRPIRTELRIG
jgi:hypothetical protein